MGANTWTQLSDMPISGDGITHMGNAVDDDTNMIYIVGGLQVSTACSTYYCFSLAGWYFMGVKVEDHTRIASTCTKVQLTFTRYLVFAYD